MIPESLMKRKEIVLGVLVVALAFVVWKTLFGEGMLMPGMGAAPTPPRAKVDLAAMKIFPVDWASLDAPRPAYDPNGRNLFQYGVIPPPQPPPLTAAEKAAIAKAQAEAEKARLAQEEANRLAMEEANKRAQEQAAQQAEIAKNTPPPKPPPPEPPPITYKFIGYIGPSNAKVAVLYDGTDTLFVRSGETLPKGIKVLEIGYESIKFGFTDPQFKDQSRTLPMSSSY
ncbi:MAG TPA: hypothetical protein VFQ07_15270 [Candidatus Polarisedimenticolia bacterium]|nr:hypothetical protein [Candidatus Polarisedimenticolia bacterium]